MSEIGKGYFRGYIELDEGRMSYLYRTGVGPCLILIPGSWSDTRQWTDVVRDLPSEMALALVELRGHGCSWPPPNKGSVTQFAQDVIGVADSIGLDRFFVGGHSIGGMVALEVAHRCPDRIHGVISVEGWTRYQAEQNAFQGLKYNTLSADQLATSADLKRPVTETWSDRQMDEFRQIWKQWDGYNFLCQTKLPILELWGDRAFQKRPELKSLSILERENIQVRWLSGASHLLPLERPREVALAIADFVRYTIQK